MRPHSGFFGAYQIHILIVCIYILGRAWHLQPNVLTTMHIQMLLFKFHKRLLTHSTRLTVQHIEQSFLNPTHHCLVKKSIMLIYNEIKKKINEQYLPKQQVLLILSDVFSRVLTDQSNLHKLKQNQVKFSHSL